MSTIQLDLDEEIAALLQRSNKPVPQVARELIILELYRRGAVSSGKAAQLFDMSRFEFIRYASRLGIAFFDLTDDEWKAEQAHAETLCHRLQLSPTLAP
jgi:predicted HTH domain antitoxin